MHLRMHLLSLYRNAHWSGPLRAPRLLLGAILGLASFMGGLGVAIPFNIML